MAKLTTFFVVVVIYIACSSFAPSFGDITTKPAPKNAEYLKNCAKKISEKCGKEIYEGVFENKSVTSECCTNLVGLGQPCHDALLRAILEFPHIGEKVNLPQFLSKGNQIWSHCLVSSTSSPTSS